MFQLVTYDSFPCFVFTYSMLSKKYSTCLNYTTWGFREWSKREKIVKVVVIVSLLISHQLKFDLDT